MYISSANEDKIFFKAYFRVCINSLAIMVQLCSNTLPNKVAKRNHNVLLYSKKVSQDSYVMVIVGFGN